MSHCLCFLFVGHFIYIFNFVLTSSPCQLCLALKWTGLSGLSAALLNLPSQKFRSLGLGSNAMITVPIVVNYATSKSLERLNLAGNLFRTLGFGINMFPGMESTLKYLILQRCMIETIHPNTFDNLDVLEYLNLGKLSIKHKPFLQYRNNTYIKDYH